MMHFALNVLSDARCVAPPPGLSLAENTLESLAGKELS